MCLGYLCFHMLLIYKQVRVYLLRPRLDCVKLLREINFQNLIFQESVSWELVSLLSVPLELEISGFKKVLKIIYVC